MIYLILLSRESMINRYITVVLFAILENECLEPIEHSGFCLWQIDIKSPFCNKLNLTKYKKSLFLWVLMLLVLPIAVQAQDRNNDDEVVKLDRSTRYRCVPNQLLVKFHDYSDIRVDAAKGGKRFVSAAKAELMINQVLEEYDVAEIEQLVPNFVMPKSPRSCKSFGGQDVVEHDLSQIHLITLTDSSAKNHYQLIEALRAIDEVEFAEPNYICYALGAPAEGESMAEALAIDGKRGNDPAAPKSNFSTNDPMYSMQWGFTATSLDTLLMQPKLDSSAARKIIAIIDTGVDVDHPDLAANIWTNAAEQNGAEGQDDDNNGFADDIHGWDFVNQTGNMHDFNSHGTHCAGIAAAVGHNGIGVIGANPDALIMPVTVMQSDGTGSISTIIQGIAYAAQNGADVISMSLGTYTHSIALEQALAQAYQRCLLVAAAGNDAAEIDKRCNLLSPGPMFPGAFTFVIGVQATLQVPESCGYLACFSNYDCDGPSYSQFGEEQLYNYEISAPGVSIMSTVPNGQYRSYSGTSMACPLVAGGLSALMDRRDYVNKEVLFGDMINYNEEFYHINFMNMYNADSVAPAKLQMVALEINDTLYGDSSMYADAGERVQLYPTIRTVWGPADSIDVWLEFQEFEDTNTLQILNNHVDFGWPLSSYAKSKARNPIDIQIANNVVDGRHICLVLCATSPTATDTLRHEFVLNVTNGVKLGGMITHNDTLWPDVQYIVTRNLAIASGVTLVVKPGTTIKFKDDITLGSVGTLLAIGTPDSMITFTKTDLGVGWGGLSLSVADSLSYCNIEWINNTSIIRGGSSGRLPVIRNSIIRDNHTSTWYYTQVFSRCNVFNNSSGSSMPTRVLCWSGEVRVSNNNICNNIATSSPGYLYHTHEDSQIDSLNIFNNTAEGSIVSLYAESERVAHSSLGNEIYWGSTVERTIRSHIYDFDYPGCSSLFHIDLDTIINNPIPSCHGVVWKVETQGFDCQDEFDSIIPLGPGTHEFKVYFNRAMDTSVTPMLAMGVRPPYTQTAIGDNSYWSADSTIWTAHLTLTGREAIDGLNRIYVANAKDDEHFEIPYENLRFNVQVSSSGAMSAGFQATPGIGKVDLEWNDQEVNYEDFMGFNLYRYQYDSVLIPAHYDDNWNWINDTTVWMPTDTILLNTTLLQDTLFTDYDVVPGQRYYYYYKILNTSLTEIAPSKTVSCVPQSSIRGDANGSYAVDVADVITVVNYMTNQNPQPFLFDASDVNGDGIIDVLDVVGIINIILYGDQGKTSYEQQTAIYTVEDGILYVDSPVALAGLQFTLNDCTMADIEVLDALNGFELINAPVGDGDLMLMAYSMSGMQIPAGKTALLRIGDKTIDNIVLSDPQGHNVTALKGGEVGITDIATLPAQIMKVFPNPFEKEVTITFNLGTTPSRTTLLTFTDILGHQVFSHEMPVDKAGRYAYTWNAEGMAKGIYFVTLSIDGTKAHTTKVVLK